MTVMTVMTANTVNTVNTVMTNNPQALIPRNYPQDTVVVVMVVVVGDPVDQSPQGAAVEEVAVVARLTALRAQWLLLSTRKSDVLGVVDSRVQRMWFDQQQEQPQGGLHPLTVTHGKTTHLCTSRGPMHGSTAIVHA